MLTSYNNYALQAAYNDEQADSRIAVVERYISDNWKQRSDPVNCNYADWWQLPLMTRNLDEWRHMPRSLKSDPAKPLRDLFDLVKGSTIGWLFVGQSAIVFCCLAISLVRHRRLNDTLGVLLLFVLPTWAYLFALSLVINPILRYMDVTSPFVYIALMVGTWSGLSASLRWGRQAAGLLPVSPARV